MHDRTNHTVMEWLKLEETSGGPVVQTCCSSKIGSAQNLLPSVLPLVLSPDITEKNLPVSSLNSPFSCLYTLQTTLQVWFTSPEHRGRITYLDLLATHFLRHARIPLAFFLPQAHTAGSCSC